MPNSASTQMRPRRTASRLPRISAARLEKAAADGCDQPILAIEHKRRDAQDDTVLYLAYGSNMAAATFEGMRGIRPLASTSVSVPTLDLVFDQPGMPYLEPCFANTALRKRVPKIPDRPPKFPPVPVPDPPAPPVGPAVPPPGQRQRQRTADHGDPVWTGGLYAVVYEVTPQDFATILATEGGGSSYQDVLVPCLALPPAITIPEKPPLPEPPKPFFAHTLWAPQPIEQPPPFSFCDDDDDDRDPFGLRRRWRALRRRLLRLALTPVRRPDAAYAQPSPRYLQRLADGAREHELPPQYQAWLAALAAYRTTTCRQRVGRALLLLVAALPVAAGAAALFLWARRSGRGRPPLWLLAAVHAVHWALWRLYDAVFRPVFGDGERTEVADSTVSLNDDDDDDDDDDTTRPSTMWWGRGPLTETTPLCWRSGEHV